MHFHPIYIATWEHYFPLIAPLRSLHCMQQGYNETKYIGNDKKSKGGIIFSKMMASLL